jgi:hypothetical protein
MPGVLYEMSLDEVLAVLEVVRADPGFPAGFSDAEREQFQGDARRLVEHFASEVVARHAPAREPTLRVI